MPIIPHYTKPKHTIFLVDGSGSMEPAWAEAWSALFDGLKTTDTSFSMLLFKQPRYLTENESNAILDTDERFYAIIDIAIILREKNLVRIKRAPNPQEMGIRFRGRTPLLAAIYHTIKLARENYPSADLEIIVVSDNRDSMVLNYSDYDYTDSDIIYTKTKNNIELTLMPVGSFLRKYIGKYDRVLSASHSSVATFISLI